MAVCNLFKKLDKNTGNFLMFSQYTEDLIKGLSEPDYKVIPSKFVAMDIRYKKSDALGYGYDLNVLVPTYFQNYFENACSFLRGELGNQWNPYMSSNIFWRCMCKPSSEIETIPSIYGVIDIQEDGVASSIKYIGDINIQSYGIHDGMGYTELFCHIPSSAKSVECKFSMDEVFDNSYIDDRGKIEGWDKMQDEMLDISIPVTSYSSDMKWNPIFLAESNKELDDSSFDINTILVLYDIEDSAGEKIYKNIPMGLYITGLINEDGSVNNSITKFVSHEDIYDTGTSYGLRICSRFGLTPQSFKVETSIELNDEDYSALSEAMIHMSESQAKMDLIIKELYDNSQSYKELFSIFKNNRTNVPYIKTWNGKSFWFVNGRNTGVEVYAPTEIQNPLIDFASKEEVQDIIDQLEELLIPQLSIIATILNGPFEKGTINNATIQWGSYFEGEAIEPERVFVDGVEVPAQTNQYTKQVEDDTNFIIEIKYGNLMESKSFPINFVYPSYVGLVKDIPTESQWVETLNKLDHVLNDSKSHDYTYSNHDSLHVCYAYPSSYGRLVSIEDDSFDYLDDFKYDKIEIEFNGKMIEYNVYIDKIPADVTNYTLKFR